ncbi:hypothetical protein BH11PAT3_BH11PAT3_1930 [soil metagenome]
MSALHWRDKVKLEDVNLSEFEKTFCFTHEELVEAFSNSFRAIPGKFERMLNRADGVRDMMSIVLIYPTRSMTPHMRSAFILRAACFFKKKTRTQRRHSPASR